MAAHRRGRGRGAMGDGDRAMGVWRRAEGMRGGDGIEESSLRELLLDALCVKLVARRTGAARLGRPMKLHRGTKKKSQAQRGFELATKCERPRTRRQQTRLAQLVKVQRMF